MQNNALMFISAFVAASVSASALPVLEKRAETIQEVKITFYGVPDNDPPGSAAVASDCLGRGYIAGGTGTQEDPLTFAAAPGAFDQCEVIYVPYLQKYLVFQDICAQCTTDFQSGLQHIDVFTGSNAPGGGGDAQKQCEFALTPDGGHTIERHADSGHPVNSGPLYDSSGCHTENTHLDGA